NGSMGEAFAFRWSSKHDVIVGSRDVQKAKEAAETYMKEAKESYGNSMKGSITGDENLAVTRSADVLLLSIHYEHIAEMCIQLSKLLRDDCIVISPIVPMTKTGAGFVYIPLEQAKKPAAEIVADNLPPRSRVVLAFHTIYEARVKNMKIRGVEERSRRRKNWMSAMGILFIVMAVIIALRNLYFVTTNLSFGFYLDNYTNSQITNEKFVIGMLIGGGILLYWGYFKKREDYGPPDEHERRRFGY